MKCSNSTEETALDDDDEALDGSEVQLTDLATTWQARKHPAASTLAAASLLEQKSVEDKTSQDQALDLSSSNRQGENGLEASFARQRDSPRSSGYVRHFRACSEDSVAVEEPLDAYARSKDGSQVASKDQSTQAIIDTSVRAEAVEPAERITSCTPCLRCVLKKTKCNRQQPCDTCQRYPGVECVYTDTNDGPTSSDCGTLRKPLGAANALDPHPRLTPVPDSASDASPELPVIDHLQALKDMGFELFSAQTALRATRGDFDQALDVLLGTSDPEDLRELSPSRQLAAQKSLDAPIFPGMSKPYQLPETAITCLVDGCPRKGQEPEKTAGSLRARLREHMKRRHGWPREKVRAGSSKPDLKSAHASVEKSRSVVQASLPSTPVERSGRKPRVIEVLASDVDSDVAIAYGRSCSNCDATASSFWHSSPSQLGKITLCNRCYMIKHANGRGRSNGYATQDASRSPVSPRSTTETGVDIKKRCSRCSVTFTSQWHPKLALHGQRTLCHRCYMYEYQHSMPRPLALTGSRNQSSTEQAIEITAKDSPFSIKKKSQSCSSCHATTIAKWDKDDDGRSLCEACMEHVKNHGDSHPSHLWIDELRSRHSLVSATIHSADSTDESSEPDSPVVYKRRKIYHSRTGTLIRRSESSMMQQDESQELLNRGPLHSIAIFGQSTETTLQPPQDNNLLSENFNHLQVPKQSNFEDFQPPSPVLSSSNPMHPRLDHDGLARLAQQYGNETTVRLVTLLYSLLQFRDGKVSKGAQFVAEEDRLIKHLKDDLNLRWDMIQRFLPHRSSWATLQTRYSQKLKHSLRRSRATSTEDSDAKSTPGEEVRVQNNLSDTGRRRSRRAVANIAPGTYVEPPPLNSQSFDFQQQTSTTKWTSEDEKPEKLTAGNAHENVIGTNISRRSAEGMSYGSRAFELDQVVRQRDLFALTSGIAKMTRPKRRSTQILRPYLSRRERYFLQQNPTIWESSTPGKWNGAILHVDFSDEELRHVLICASEVFGVEIGTPDLTLRQRIALQVRGASRAQLAQVADKMICNSTFINRSHESVEQFLLDIAVSMTERQRRFTEASHLGSRTPKTFDLCDRLRKLELGLASHSNTRGAFDTLGPRLHFKGTSSDVNVVNWAVDGNRFIVGSAALTDESSMQYNRSNNLLFGDISHGTLHELAQHITKRSAAKGVNSRQEMMATQEPFLFHTISAAQFTPDGRTMITTGYDCTAVLWDVSDKIPKAGIVYPHSSAIDVLAVNSSGLFATGIKSVLTKKQYPAVRILRYDIDQNSADWELVRGQAKLRKYYSQRGPDVVEPSCLRFGQPFGGQDKYLLAGFCTRDGDYGSGEVTLWDVTRDDAPLISSTSTNVFDAVWSPTTFGLYAIGYSAAHSKSVNRGTRSIVRLFDSFRSPDADVVFRKTRMCELECPALDINDLLFCDRDANLISAGCTNGNVYTWDLRMPDDVLHTFQHAPTLSVHFHEDDLERVDTGVRFLSWGQGSRHLYSGSSDGVVTAWDPYRSPEDAFLHDVVRLDSGIMSGAFSPDFTDLLIGDIHGSVSLLSVGSDRSPKLDMSTAAAFEFQEATETKGKLRRKYGDAATPDKRTEAAAAADELIRSGQIELRPFGNLPIRQAVQGPNYDLPMPDGHSDIFKLRAAADAFQAKLRLHEAEPRCVCTSNAQLLTEEEQGDSGAWKQRIPAAIRFGDISTAVNDSLARSASTPSRLNRDQLDVRCFRCDKTDLAKRPVDTSNSDEILMCHNCRAQWYIDVLGYTPLCACQADKGNARSQPNHFADVDVSDFDGDFAPEAEVDNLLMGVSEHYQSMWGQTQTKTE